VTCAYAGRVTVSPRGSPLLADRTGTQRARRPWLARQLAPGAACVTGGLGSKFAHLLSECVSWMIIPESECLRCVYGKRARDVDMTDWINVRVDDASFGLLDRGEVHGEVPIESADFSNGLIVTMTAGALISTGIHTGYVRVRVTSADTPPQDLGFDNSWDDIIEASVRAPNGRLYVEGHETGPVQGLPILSSAGPGWYRVRAYVRGRDTHYDAVQLDPVEDYLLHIWPAEPAASLIIRATDRCGAGLRSSAAKRATAAIIDHTADKQQDEQQHRARLHEAILKGTGRLPQ
jgi:hypothetical protein